MVDSTSNNPPKEIKPELPVEPRRVKAFANFFKNYMSISSVVAAALPIPVTMIGLIPVYEAHSKILSTYTPMLCFLILGYLFFQRHGLARFMFGVTVTRRKLDIDEYEIRRNWENRDQEMRQANVDHEEISNLKENFLAEVRDWQEYKAHATRRARVRSKFFSFVPFLLVVATIFCLLGYQRVLDHSLDQAAAGTFEIWTTYANIIDESHNASYVSNLLSNTPLPGIPNSTTLMILYIGIFLFAEAAFILMAIKEYLQDLLGIDDVEEIIERKWTGTRERY